MTHDQIVDTLTERGVKESPKLACMYEKRNKSSGSKKGIFGS